MTRSTTTRVTSSRTAEQHPAQGTRETSPPSPTTKQITEELVAVRGDDDVVLDVHRPELAGDQLGLDGEDDALAQHCGIRRPTDWSVPGHAVSAHPNRRATGEPSGRGVGETLVCSGGRLGLRAA